MKIWLDKSCPEDKRITLAKIDGVYRDVHMEYYFIVADGYTSKMISECRSWLSKQAKIRRG